MGGEFEYKRKCLHDSHWQAFNFTWSFSKDANTLHADEKIGVTLAVKLSRCMVPDEVSDSIHIGAAGPCDSRIANNGLTELEKKDLEELFWSVERNDNFVTATEVGEASALNCGYKFIRIEGYVYKNKEPGMVPLKLFYGDARRDNFTTAHPEGEKAAINSGYRYIRDEGYVFRIFSIKGGTRSKFAWPSRLHSSPAVGRGSPSENMFLILPIIFIYPELLRRYRFSVNQRVCRNNWVLSAKMLKKGSDDL